MSIGDALAHKLYVFSYNFGYPTHTSFSTERFAWLAAYKRRAHSQFIHLVAGYCGDGYYTLTVLLFKGRINFWHE